MQLWLIRIGTLLAAALLAISVYNASWLAAAPDGHFTLLAHRGVHQTAEPGADCLAARMTETGHVFLESTVPAFRQAFARRAGMVEVEVRTTSDGALVLYPDATLDCRTDGEGPIAEHSLAELERLDLGFGYTADDGASFPLRGTGVGHIPTVDQLLTELPANRFLFRFAEDDARQADLLAAAFERAGREIDDYYGFYGPAAPVERIRELAPDAWAFTIEEVRRCSGDYIRMGWTGGVPASCRGGTIAIPLNRQWMFWGFPNRMAARMEAADTRMIMIGPYRADRPPAPLTEIEQLTDVPASFTGHIWVGDIWNMGPAVSD